MPWICSCVTARALGAERLVETNNVAGAFNASTPSIRHIAEQGFDKVFFELNLDSDETVKIPRMAVSTCQLITGIDNDNLGSPGVDAGLAELQEAVGALSRTARRPI